MQNTDSKIGSLGLMVRAVMSMTPRQYTVSPVLVILQRQRTRILLTLSGLILHETSDSKRFQLRRRTSRNGGSLGLMNHEPGEECISIVHTLFYMRR